MAASLPFTPSSSDEELEDDEDEEEEEDVEDEEELSLSLSLLLLPLLLSRFLSTCFVFSLSFFFGLGAFSRLTSTSCLSILVVFSTSLLISSSCLILSARSLKSRSLFCLSFGAGESRDLGAFLCASLLPISSFCVLSFSGDGDESCLGFLLTSSSLLLLESCLV